MNLHSKSILIKIIVNTKVCRCVEVEVIFGREKVMKKITRWLVAALSDEAYIYAIIYIRQA